MDHIHANVEITRNILKELEKRCDFVLNDEKRCQLESLLVEHDPEVVWRSLRHIHNRDQLQQLTHFLRTLAATSLSAQQRRDLLKRLAINNKTTIHTWTQQLYRYLDNLAEELIQEKFTSFYLYKRTMKQVVITFLHWFIAWLFNFYYYILGSKQEPKTKLESEQIHLVNLCHTLRRLLCSGNLSIALIRELLKSLDSELKIKKLTKSLELIFEYRLRVDDELQKLLLLTDISGISKVCFNKAFPGTREKTCKELMEELQDSNDPALLKSGIWWDFHEKLSNHSNGKSKYFSKNLEISKWKKNDFKNWNYHRIQSSTPIEKYENIAVIRRAIEYHTGKTPRDAQMLALFLMLNPKKNCGRLAQINMSEGKSMIIAMQAAYYALMGYCVDVITSSPVSAKLQVNEFKGFYKLFDLSAYHNINTIKGYKRDICYGTVTQFQNDLLEDEFCKNNRRCGRDFDFVILDEVDNALIEGNYEVVQLTTPIQFLNIEGYRPEPENIISNYLISNLISQVGYLRRYRNNIFGLTGTLGNETIKSFLNKMYNADSVIIPPFKVKQHYELAPIIINRSENDWYEEILRNTLAKLNAGRAVLVITKYIKQSEHLLLLLEQSGYKRAKMFSFKTADEVEVMRRYLEPGDVVVATNIAGWGTNLLLDRKVEENGGLHVCLTFVPQNARVEQQNQGRTARTGDRGTSQFVVYDEKKSDLTTIKLIRDKAQKNSIHKFGKQIEILLSKDRVFSEFCNLLTRTIKCRFNLRHVTNVIKHKFAFWARNIKPETEDDISEFEKQFEDFKCDISKVHRDQFLEDDIFMKIHCGYHMFHTKYYIGAINAFTRAITYDSSFSENIYYYRAFSYIAQYVSSENECDFEKAKEDFNCARRLIQDKQSKIDYIRNNSVNPDSNVFLQKLSRKSKIYDIQKKSIDSAIGGDSVLYDRNVKKQIYFIKIDEFIEKEDGENNYKDEIDEFNINCLFHIIILSENISTVKHTIEKIKSPQEGLTAVVPFTDSPVGSTKPNKISNFIFGMTSDIKENVINEFTTDRDNTVKYISNTIIEYKNFFISIIINNSLVFFYKILEFFNKA